MAQPAYSELRVLLSRKGRRTAELGAQVVGLESRLTASPTSKEMGHPSFGEIGHRSRAKRRSNSAVSMIDIGAAF